MLIANFPTLINQYAIDSGVDELKCAHSIPIPK